MPGAFSHKYQKSQPKWLQQKGIHWSRQLKGLGDSAILSHYKIHGFAVSLGICLHLLACFLQSFMFAKLVSFFLNMDPAMKLELTSVVPKRGDGNANKVPSVTMINPT